MVSVRKYVKDIREFIKSPNVWFFFTPIRRVNIHGYCITTSGGRHPIVILLDHRKCLFATIVHECLHGIHQNTKERKIETLERRVLKEISKTQIMGILSCFVKHAKFLKNLDGIE